MEEALGGCSCSLLAPPPPPQERSQNLTTPTTHHRSPARCFTLPVLLMEKMRWLSVVRMLLSPSTATPIGCLISSPSLPPANDRCPSQMLEPALSNDATHTERQVLSDPSIHPSIHPSIQPPTHPSVCLPACLSIWLPDSLSLSAISPTCPTVHITEIAPPAGDKHTHTHTPSSAASSAHGPRYGQGSIHTQVQAMADPHPCSTSVVEMEPWPLWSR